MFNDIDLPANLRVVSERSVLGIGAVREILTVSPKDGGISERRKEITSTYPVQK